MICIQHDHRVHVRYIYPRFYDRRCDQHIVFAFRKIDYDILELLFTHLAVSDNYFGVRHQRFDIAGDTVYRLNAVVQHVYLTASCQLLFYRFSYHEIVLLHNICLDRISVFRRLLDDAHVLNT